MRRASPSLRDGSVPGRSTSGGSRTPSSPRSPPPLRWLRAGPWVSNFAPMQQETMLAFVCPGGLVFLRLVVIVVDLLVPVLRVVVSEHRAKESHGGGQGKRGGLRPSLPAVSKYVFEGVSTAGALPRGTDRGRILGFDKIRSKSEQPSPECQAHRFRASSSCGRALTSKFCTQTICKFVTVAQGRRYGRKYCAPPMRIRGLPTTD